MKLICLFALLALAYGSDVLEFTDSDFADHITHHDIILVEFFAPWCGHCKKLAPEYEKAATELKRADPAVALAKVDCTASTEVCGKYGVSGYPTLKIFRNGEMVEDYNGPREAGGIVKTMKSKAGPSSRNMESVADAEKFFNTNDLAVVGFFGEASSDLEAEFKKLADAHSNDFKFGHSQASAVLEKYGQKDAVVIYRPKQLQSKLEPATVKYEGGANLQKMKQWITDNIQGLAGHRDQGNAGQFQKPLVVAYYDVDYVKNTKGTNYWRNRVMKVAKHFRESNKKVHFAVSSHSDFSHELGEFGLTYTDKPVVGAWDSKDQKFVMQDEFSMDNLEKFVKELLDGKLKPYLKSEPIPASNDEPVKVVVAEQFNEIVNDESKDVLIEFYAPWCGHCKTLAPKYDELAQKLEKETDIVIAKMDATANDVPAPYEVRGFPTLYFAPKNSKQSPKKYEGGREVDDFMKYLARESTDELHGLDRKGKKKKQEL